MIYLLVALMIINAVLAVGSRLEKLFYREKEKPLAVAEQTRSNSNYTTNRIHRKGA